MNFKVALKVLRAVTGKMQKELAENCGFDPSYISQIETGIRTPNTEAMEKLSDEFGVASLVFYTLASNKSQLEQLTDEQKGVVGKELINLLIKHSD